MMKDLDGIYDRAFFSEWGRGNESYVKTAEFITRIIHGEFRPRRLVDLGCGCGVYAHFFKDLGTEVVALDGVQPPPELSFPVSVELRDLTEPFSNEWGVFDLALCLEVAEHISEELSGTFLGNIAQFSDTLVLSCARPKQGGAHHVNEKPKRYWHERLKSFGFEYNRPRTGVLQEAFKAGKPQLMWMCQQISVYEKPGVEGWAGEKLLP